MKEKFKYLEYDKNEYKNLMYKAQKDYKKGIALINAINSQYDITFNTPHEAITYALNRVVSFTCKINNVLVYRMLKNNYILDKIIITQILYIASNNIHFSKNPENTLITFERNWYITFIGTMLDCLDNVKNNEDLKKAVNERLYIPFFDPSYLIRINRKYSKKYI